MARQRVLQKLRFVTIQAFIPLLADADWLDAPRFYE